MTMSPLRIRAVREERGLTQEGLAAKAGISREYLARLETGRQDPRISVMTRLAQALGTSVDELLSAKPQKGANMVKAACRACGEHHSPNEVNVTWAEHNPVKQPRPYHCPQCSQAQRRDTKGEYWVSGSIFK